MPQWVEQHTRRERVILAALSAPPWVDRKALRRLRNRARELSTKTGTRHVVDHIVPVSHPYVCGLTVPWNLQVIAEGPNAAKGNRWCPDQVEAFIDPEQFRLL